MPINIILATTRNEFDSHRKKLEGKKIGFVPTMGNLHEGHLSLVSASIEEMECTIVSIFVNPKQFGPTEDFNKYPRTQKEDIEKIYSLNQKYPNIDHTIIVFIPNAITEIYPPRFNTTIAIYEITQKLEGKLRPTHFDGVTTVVYRLFKIAKADVAYFGQKDYQQCLVIKKMISDLEIPIKLKIMPIVRNSQGLALSSRNQYLLPEDQKVALNLPTTLNKIKMLIDEKKNYQTVINKIISEDNNWDYLEVLDAETLEKISEEEKIGHFSSQTKIIVGAYRVKTTRLLDNILC